MNYGIKTYYEKKQTLASVRLAILVDIIVGLFALFLVIIGGGHFPIAAAEGCSLALAFTCLLRVGYLNGIDDVLALKE